MLNLLKQNMIHRMNLFITKGARQSRAPGKKVGMKRYHQELERTKRVHRQHLRQTHNWPIAIVDCVCEFQVGRFRKQKAHGCRRARCLLCHFDKIFGIASVKDRIRDERYRDTLRD